MQSTSSARAHTNIALIKYWGKKNQELIIPTTSSLSLTLDRFYTDTKVTFDDKLTADTFYLNHQQMVGPIADKTFAFLKLIRQQAQIDTFATIESINHVPTAAGLASSASAFAALAGAGSKAAGLTLTKQALSRLARRGSGSAARSIFGGFSEWHAGDNDLNSFAHPIQENVTMDIQMITVVVDAHEKKITSRMGMQHALLTSPFYQTWVNEAAKDLVAMKAAIVSNDFKALGTLAENNALQMHSLNLSAKPGFTYFNGSTLEILDLVQNLRKQQILAFATMDAGPNVKIIAQSKDTATIIDILKQAFPHVQVEIAKPGHGLIYLD
ncbi:diphosphomevalonate decarboxylase [Weissella beninensis]|uniref:diphosphomevalonate decarboxylase n=1 Tax=Periweissella beninensis TaxID=504936 RepID=A0ABT0VI55_9LACO|nr:diphosphomevalonate decarboxylase [Periweissella beninensis]MBM7544104.1 diphosphomevalonate decarboxylase [Periweissella beninensis]MCM2437523.1 diphosphomevalonate decarboxylase [Periweissella beninensis]